MRRFPLLLPALLLLPFAARAWPVEHEEALKPGEPRFFPIGSLAWAEVEDTRVAEAELMPTGELLLTAKREGKTLLMLYVQGRPVVWRVRVGTGERARAEPGPDALASALNACPGLKVHSEAGQAHLTATVATEACRQALRSALQSDAFVADALDLTFDLPVLQSQLKDLTEGARRVAPAVVLSYLGAGLLLKGEATPEQHRALLWELFRRGVGRLPMDDRLGTKEAEKTP